MPESTARPTILIVDDASDMIEVLIDFLSDKYEIIVATTGRQALSLVGTTKPDLILLDINMPVMSGYEVCQALKENESTRDIPVIFLTRFTNNAELVKGFASGAVDYVTKPFMPNELLARVATHLQLRMVRREVESKNAELEEARELVQQQKDELAEWNTSLKQRVLQQSALIRSKSEEARQQSDRTQKITEKITNAFVIMLANVQEMRHAKLDEHSRTIEALAASMASTLKLSPAEQRKIAIAARLHDIGLISMSDRGFLFKGVLSPDDFAEYRSHPVRGQTIMGISEDLQEIGLIIRHHHEEFAGNGYPDGLIGKQIPLGSRIIHVANVISTIFSKETGPDAKYQVTSKLSMVMGSLLDPDLAAAGDQAIKDVLVVP
jgi:putative two-component system response regulator